jgi:hypothetical protein
MGSTRGTPMSEVAERRRPPTTIYEKPRRQRALTARQRETAAVFFVAFVSYAVLGWRIVVRDHIVMFDAVARLSHAYFVWWNSPPKLAAVGFVWPPIATVVFLPFTLVKPLATSLLALPLTSAFFAGVMFVFLNKTLALLGLGLRYRIPMLLLFALNPMVAFYSANGMSEVVYLSFLVASVYFFLSWYFNRRGTMLVNAGIFFSVGILSRYEVFTWAIVLAGVICAVLVRRRASRVEIEGTLISYLAPLSYGVGLWLFFNWLILNDPLFWLKHQAPGGPTNGPPGTTGASLTVAGPRPSAAHVSSELVGLNWHLFVLTLPTLTALLALFAFRSDLMAMTLAVFLSLNAAFTGLLIYVSHAEAYSQLRYNMRAMPLALIGSAWVVTRFAGRARVLAGAVVVVLLAVAIPQTWQVMQTFPQQYLEQSFTRAVATGKDQEGSGSLGGYRVGIAEQRRMAAYVKANIVGRDAILTDDAQTFSVMLLTGAPGLFLDRIDHGDTQWLTVLDAPFGKVAYMLVSQSPDDLISARYPQLTHRGMRGFRTVYSVGSLVLIRVARVPPS